ncbi:MAG: endolytic transglycosylase MltG [Desulfuromonadales bacterium]
MKTLARTKLLLLVVALITLGAIGLGLWWQHFLNTPVAPGQEQVIVVAPGSPFTRIARQLEQAGVVSDATRLTWLARWREATGAIHAGEYAFADPARPDQVLERLISGDIRKFQVTIPEGFNLAQIAERLAAAGLGSAEEILALSHDPQFIADFGIPATSLEGYLFPETYTYTATTTPRQILSAMVEQLERRLTPELLAAAKARNLNRHQLMTLASIIQKEAGNVMEMPLISAVFHNRLQRGIALQADPTVIYGIPDFDGNLTRRHLETPTPYNTYQKRGLPPGPIASPGQFALIAAANPADSKALYFVARGDGTHHFSTTLQEHNRAVKRYQLKR